jgi:hypothetical protein
VVTGNSLLTRHANGSCSTATRKVRIEFRQEVTTVKLTINQRPSELLAACALVHDGSGRIPASNASSHNPWAYVGVVGGLGVGTPLTQARRAQDDGTSVSASALKAKDTSKTNMIFGDVRGIPPRGRPV